MMICAFIDFFERKYVARAKQRYVRWVEAMLTQY